MGAGSHEQALLLHPVTQSWQQGEEGEVAAFLQLASPHPQASVLTYHLALAPVYQKRLCVFNVPFF